MSVATIEPTETQPVTLTINELVPLIRKWSEERDILKNSTALAQAEKTAEEMTELLVAVARLDTAAGIAQVLAKSGVYFGREFGDKLRHNVSDAIGDIFVTLCNVADLSDIDIHEAVHGAYNEIRDRKGKLGSDGKFHKEQ